MKIALFVHCFFPEHFYGTETYTLQLAQHLQNVGHEVTVVSAIFQGESRKQALLTEYVYQGIRVVCIDKNYVPHSRIKETYYQEPMRDVLREVLSKLRPDLVHVTHLINHTAVLLEVAREQEIPTVATLTDFFGFCYNKKLEAADGSLCAGPNRRRTNCLACHLKADISSRPAWMRSVLTTNTGTKLCAELLTGIGRLPVIRSRELGGLVQDIKQYPDVFANCYRNYRAVITPTRFLRKAYEANGLAVPAFDIRFGVDVNREPKPARQAGSKIQFGFIGQIAPHKGTDILIDAFSSLPKGKAELHIYGPEDQSVHYMAALRQAAAGLDIRFHGTFPSERMAEVLAGLDVLVIPSRWYENCPLVLLNGLATHTPVVVSDVEGMTEFVEEGVSGLSFRRGSAASLRQILQRFIDSSGLAANLSTTTEYPRTTFAMVQDVLSVYHRVMMN
ncbi:MAG: glycosyl transferase [Deltaproteobacteria bacterium RIFOXYD12_FULL_50_9]|nr:MAG: glycosyl transferase [Deltaproteobacteria bacterium RIFOXYD12_FULL_50_9]